MENYVNLTDEELAIIIAGLRKEWDSRAFTAERAETNGYSSAERRNEEFNAVDRLLDKMTGEKAKRRTNNETERKAF